MTLDAALLALPWLWAGFRQGWCDADTTRSPGRRSLKGRKEFALRIGDRIDRGVQPVQPDA